MSETIPLLQLENISMTYSGTEVLHSISLSVRKGEFLTLLGPSGCGKTTTLRIIAGLAQQTSGRVLLDGKDISQLPPEKREVNTVFQSYALFPHMSVEKNIAYGLRLRRTPAAEIKARVAEMLSLIRLPEYGKRMPSELSGGQRQRVAIARALILRPRVLLLDEPLGALDLQLRRQMQQELKEIQKEVGITFIYITHDQEEALNMSDTIAVMNAGRFEQIGSPSEVYESPKTLFTAGFIGQSNLLECSVKAAENGVVSLEMDGEALPAMPNRFDFRAGDRVRLVLRSERIKCCAEKPDGFSIPVTLSALRYAGSSMRAILTTGQGREITALGHEPARLAGMEGKTVYIAFDADEACLVPDKKDVDEK
ncbi:MAG: ABC transporter ATP-binding protein [Eubacteriales bacterium]|nr:ABC transporter ATP-binding protein [Eubacteriales bacterium]MDD3882451.1 ABC transporter ATP-binding protein [Eubacteriales bacterium]MDD4513173.1 ABC transporter ATP-binding protein [Eubacteriales bacterium]